MSEEHERMTMIQERGKWKSEKGRNRNLVRVCLINIITTFCFFEPTYPWSSCFSLWAASRDPQSLQTHGPAMNSDTWNQAQPAVAPSGALKWRKRNKQNMCTCVWACGGKNDMEERATCWQSDFFGEPQSYTKTARDRNVQITKLLELFTYRRKVNILL